MRDENANSEPVDLASSQCGIPELARWHVRQLEQRIAALEAENAALIASANTFADLADRLNRRLRENAATK